ncbi:MAG TPA: ATP-grasp domain-containing protein [Minicystis sp.]|nr:ATP-grasp domain-containing protein [Minicystis sp.]
MTSVFVELRGLLARDAARAIVEGLDGAPFADGKATAQGSARDAKQNVQLDPAHPTAKALGAGILAALNKSEPFRAAVLPHTILPLMFTRYGEGMRYGEHLDMPVLGSAAGPLRADLSMMLNEEEYTGLYEAVRERGEDLVVDPEAFAEAMYAPNHLPLLGPHTAPARWTEGESIREAWEVAQELGPAPWIVKDHVKSAKEQWHRACLVPANAGFEEFAAICERLLELRGDRFERGFVVKQYLELATLPGWTPEQRRVTDEHRLVFWEGRLVAHAPYYDVDAVLPNPGAFAFLGRTLDSPFFVADVARVASGGFTILEINDGGCAAFPERMDPRDLYRAIVE